LALVVLGVPVPAYDLCISPKLQTKNKKDEPAGHATQWLSFIAALLVQNPGCQLLALSS